MWVPEDDLATAARTAYIYGLPIVDLYRILHNFALDTTSPEFKAPLNAVSHSRALADPSDRSIVAINVDTPYSYAWLDLRGGPVELAMPPVPQGRYMSAQVVDLYTYIVGYVSPRTTGGVGQTTLIVGPSWDGSNPGQLPVFDCPTDLCLVLFRTQLFDDDDMVNVEALQNAVGVRSLAAHPLPAPTPIEPVDVRTPPAREFLRVLGWMLDLMPVLPDEIEIRASINALIAAGEQMDDVIVAGLQQGMADVTARMQSVRSSGEIFGSREFLGHDYLTRAAGAFLGILGNAAEEYLGVGYQADANGEMFDGSYRYAIRFTPESVPPVGAFWSITVYDADRLLYANDLNRYVLGSRQFADIAVDADGTRTIRIQHDRPAEISGWLPCPSGPFSLAFRTYLPGDAIRDGKWTAPPVTREDTFEPMTASET